MKFTMISTLAAALAIVSASPIPADPPKNLPGSKHLFPAGNLRLTVTTAGNQLAGYLPQLIVGYGGEVLLSRTVPGGFPQPVLTSFKGISFDKLEFGAYYYLTIQTKDSLPVTFQSQEGCPAPNIGNFFRTNNDDKLYYFSDSETLLNLWKACPDSTVTGSDYVVYWDSKNSINTKGCIKIDIHVTSLSTR